MSGWHREHPELAGTSADPAMANDGYRQARDELLRTGLAHCNACDDRRVVDGEPCPTCRPEAV